MVERLKATGQWDTLCRWEPMAVEERVLELVHTPEYVERVKWASTKAAQSGGLSHLDPDTALSAQSWEAARYAAGAAVEAAQRIARGDLCSAFCVVRPPGHHASSSEAGGFCIFNNVAIAASVLLDSGAARRVAILDYDAHHGNGTQEIFESCPSVLYVSTHEEAVYPERGFWDECGEGEARGTTLNVPLPGGAGDDVYAIAQTQIIQPVVGRFRPDFVLVSLGFDAFWGDPIAGMRLSLWGGYRPLLESARALAEELCEGRLMVALEGGYNPMALAYGAELVCRILAHESVEPDPLGPASNQLPVEAVRALFRDLTRLHGL